MGRSVAGERAASHYDLSPPALFAYNYPACPVAQTAIKSKDWSCLNQFRTPIQSWDLAGGMHLTAPKAHTEWTLCVHGRTIKTMLFPSNCLHRITGILTIVTVKNQQAIVLLCNFHCLIFSSHAFPLSPLSPISLRTAFSHLLLCLVATAENQHKRPTPNLPSNFVFWCNNEIRTH